MIKTCVVCGAEFESKMPWGKYCSLKCSKKMWSPKTKEERDRLEKSRSEYLDGRGSRREKHICECCGKEFSRKAHHDDTFRFCSRKCAYEFRANKKKKTLERKAQEKQRKIVTRICACCGKEFQCYSTQPNKYCSEECRKPKRNPRVKKLKPEPKRYTRICAYCGKAFTTTKPNKKCCSAECSRKNDNRRRDHRLDGKIVDNDITLPRVAKRDKNVCQLCGKKVNWKVHYNSNEYPSIDHIVPITCGGLHEWGNVQLAHRGCNTAKNNNFLF